jgi:hypothetical protein
MNHRDHIAAEKAKKEQRDDNDDLLKQIEEAVKPDNRDKQEASNGRKTED